MTELTLNGMEMILKLSAKMHKYRKAFLGIALFLFMVSVASMVHAFAAPAAGSTAYDVYDIFVNQILQGPIGFAASVALIAFGIYMAVAQGAFGVAIMSIIGGGILYRADTIVTSLGCMM